VPKFDRTMSDIYQDELYSPTSITSAPAPPPRQSIPTASLLSPYRSVVNERLRAANQARSTSPSGSASRDPSPFRQGSPFAAPADDFGSHKGRIGTAAAQREQQKAEADALAYERHHPRPQDTSEPPTISPKDAVLDFHAPVDESATSLFPEPSNTSSQEQGYDISSGRQHISGYALPATFGFVPPSMPIALQEPSMSDFKFVPPRRPTTSGSDQEQPLEFPAHLISMETTKSEPDVDSPVREIAKPASTTADTGTYTCTYHGCTERFESPAKLQKHKREGHRSVAAGASQSPTRASPSGITSAALLRNSQAGPHKCERINPSTGKPCNTVFSRPYDLTRHEDTIHNGQKKKVRCNLCTDDKSFSRSDALTRHMRVVHPDVDFPGKHRRRHMY